MMRVRLTRLAGLLALAGSLAMTQGGQRADAAYIICRTDPLMTFSDGSVIDLSAVTVSTQPQITHASYTVHMPVGVKNTGITYDASAAIESVTFVADQPARHYRFDLVATTIVPTVVYEDATVNHTQKIGAGPAGTKISVTMTM
jgi:hypothetical protein